jgi:hypothetical protein
MEPHLPVLLTVDEAADMRGAPARAIQELAGHQDLMTTQRYMHLSPTALEAAIRLLDRPGMSPVRGEILEAAGKQGCF